MKKIIFITFIILFSNCKTGRNTTKGTDLSQKFAASITAEELKEHLYTYASDEFEGRLTGEIGQKKAVAYLKDFYVKNKIIGGLKDSTYFQKIPSKFLSNNHVNMQLKDSENVLAFIKGNEFPEEVIVISAHLDHEGVKQGKIYNGADDDGSGTVAILEIAQAFQKAVELGNTPKRSILFLHVTGEEKGLLGSSYYVQNPIYTLANTVVNLNIDMIGRVDKNHVDNTNYIYLIGSDKLSTELHNLSEDVNKKYSQINLDYTYNEDDDPNFFFYRSDHYNFAKHNIPIIFYFNGIHEDYHKHTDTPDKINYELLEKRSRLIFHTAWEIANRNKRITNDKK